MIKAAGLLVYRKNGDRYEVLLTHPGGPFWAKKDDWSIPKGEIEDGEDHMTTLRREFVEEVGIEPPLDKLIDLGEAKASGGKTNHIWAVEANLDLLTFHCDSMVTMRWPPRSGTSVTFPENDRAEWFTLDKSYRKIFKSQMVFIERLASHLGCSLEPIETPTNTTLF